MDAEERDLLALQNEFMSSKDRPAAVVKNAREQPLSSWADSKQKSIKASLPGTRVALNLEPGSLQAGASSDSGFAIIKDIIEHSPDQTTDLFEMPMTITNTSLRNKRIDWRNKNHTSKTQSRFAAQRKSKANLPSSNGIGDLQVEIAAENDRKIASMTDSELLAEKEELLSTLDPALLAVLEKRRHPASASDTSPEFGPQFTSENISSIPVVKSSKTVHNDTPANARQLHDLQAANIARNAQDYTSEADALQANDQVGHVHTSECLTSYEQESSGPSVHFPSGQSSEELDPSSETFLEDLKTKYFPTLQHDPSALAWMKSPTEAEDVADYHESNASLMPAQIRFDFKGNFLAPRTSREVQSDLGLHHHADAPLAAGYTIPELAHLCRSSFPTQACMAIQTIGRIMYKIGKQFYGESISGKLKHLIEKSMVEKTLLERSGDKHLSIRSYATEALWQANLGREGQIIEGQ